jgi:cell division protein FtsQ
VNQKNRRLKKAEEAASESLAPEAIDLPPAPASRPKSPGRGARVLAVLRTVLGVVLVLGIATGAAVGTRRYVRTSPRFAVSEISVTGHKRRTSDQVAQIAGLNKGANILDLDLGGARARLMADPWIADAKLARKLPDTVHVHVTEREAAGIVSIAESYLVTRDGEIIKRLEPNDPLDLPIVTGITVQQLSEDREGAVLRIKRALDLAGEYDRSALAQRMPLQEVHVSAEGTIDLVVGRNATVLKLGAAPYRRKLEQAARVVFELDKRAARAEAVMLDNEARPERVVVRLR